MWACRQDMANCAHPAGQMQTLLLGVWPWVMHRYALVHDQPPPPPTHTHTPTHPSLIDFESRPQHPPPGRPRPLLSNTIHHETQKVTVAQHVFQTWCAWMLYNTQQRQDCMLLYQ
jgi:hypothetical protein